MATYNDPSPMANPFSKRVFGNFNVDRANRGGYVRYGRNPQTLEVPNQDILYNGSPEWYRMRRGNDVQVPNQDIPLGDAADNFGNVGFINDRLFRLQDGTVMDYKTGRIFKAGHRMSYRDISSEDTGFLDANSWNSCSGPSLEDMVNHTERYVGTATPDGYVDNMDPRSARYWLIANAEAEKLKNSMTDEQKRLISAFEEHFPVSKLIEESKKPYKK